MIRIFRAALVVSAVVFLLTSCGNWDPEIVKNRENLPKLRKGMTKDEVRSVMGEPVKGTKYSEKNSDIWFYYTGFRWSDCMITKDECTPVVFNKKGKVEGWGQEYFKEHVRFPVLY